MPDLLLDFGNGLRFDGGYVRIMGSSLYRLFPLGGNMHVLLHILWRDSLFGSPSSFTIKRLLRLQIFFFLISTFGHVQAQSIVTCYNQVV